jgi:small subunit ribosomal protein S2
MITVHQQDFLDACVHLGHTARKWHPGMSKFIFMEANGIHIIDIKKTISQLNIAYDALKNITSTGKYVLFVATKDQARAYIEEVAKSVNMPYIVKRWPGGLLNNFVTIRRMIRAMASKEKLMKSPAFKNMTKKERSTIERKQCKLVEDFGGIFDMSCLPSAMVVVDVFKEKIAVSEAKKLGIPVFALVDTNSDPSNINYPIPANDDKISSIKFIVDILKQAIVEGLEARKKMATENKEDHPDHNAYKAKGNITKTGDVNNDKKDSQNANITKTTAHTKQGTPSNNKPKHHSFKKPSINLTSKSTANSILAQVHAANNKSKDKKNSNDK